MSEPKPPFIQQVGLRNFKSIRACDVALGPLTLLVGPNGSGKSNFLDALRFVAAALNDSLELALVNRGLLDELCFRPQQGPRSLSIDLRIGLPDDGRATYRVHLFAEPKEQPQVAEEACSVFDAAGTRLAGYRVRDGQVESADANPMPWSPRGSLYLPAAANLPQYRSLYHLLRKMRLHNLSPTHMRETPFSAPDWPLRLNGEGAGSVLQRIAANTSWGKQRIDQSMRAILPSLDHVTVKSLVEHFAGGDPQRAAKAREYLGDAKDDQLLRFVMRVGDELTYFAPESMSDGTLRAFGVLLALYQCADRPEDDRIPLVGIEEPESTLHPAAAGVLFDALHEASHFTQVLATTHSAELLNIKGLDPNSLLVVDKANGETVIGPADDNSLSIMKQRMYTAGELLEMQQLRPAPAPPGEIAGSSVAGPIPAPSERQ